jgi:hypothetical protein
MLAIWKQIANVATVGNIAERSLRVANIAERSYSATAYGEKNILGLKFHCAIEYSFQICS